MKFTLNVHRANLNPNSNPNFKRKSHMLVVAAVGTYLNAGTTLAVHVRAAEFGILHCIHRIRGVALNQTKGCGPTHRTTALILGR